MSFSRRAMIAGLFALAAGGLPAPAEAKRRKGRRRRGGANVSGLFGGQRGTTDGECPCNGGKVCTGARGGRYCITSSGKKRYGV